jgi:hypothetical protein
MCVLILSATFSEIFLILGRIQRDTVIKVRRSANKILLILVRFSKNIQIANLMKIRLEWAELFQAEGGQADKQTERHDETKSQFLKFCERA